MRNWIIVVGIAISFTLVAQKGGKKDNLQGGKKVKSQAFKQQKNTGKTKGKQPIKFQNKKNKGNAKVNKSLKHKGEAKKMNHTKVKAKSGSVKNQKYQSKFKYKKGHVNHVYMYGYSPFRYPTKNYGQWRSQQARNKHKTYHPTFQIDIINAILMVRERNAFLCIEIDHKLDRYNKLVIERHNKGLISDAEFSLRLGHIKKMKKRRGSYRY